MDSQKIMEFIHNFKHDLEKYPVQLIYLHGSVATGDDTPLSDVDLAVVVENDLPANAYLDLELELEVLFCKLLNSDRVDVRIMNKAPLGFKGQVLTKGKLVYSRNESFRVDYETETRRRYFDFLPVIRQMTLSFFTHLKQE